MYFLSCTVSKLWPIIGQIFASDRGVPHFNALAKGNRPCEYPDNLYLSRKYTVPQKTSAFLFFQYLSEETNCNCCTAAYLFTYFCLLLPVICVALFYCQFFYLLGQSFSKPPMPTHNRLFSESPTFGGTQHYLQSDVKVLHFTR